MTLRVDIEQFASTAIRMLGSAPVFLRRQRRGTAVSAADAAKEVRILSYSEETLETVREQLQSQGLEVFEGEWIVPGDTEVESFGAYVVGIAYASGEGRSGLWMDAVSEAITPAQAVRAMYDEMRENGEVAEVAFEDFVRAANPNVIVLSPYEIRHFLSEKDA